MRRVVRLLSRPESYPEATHEVARFETHISWVFLTEQYVYKLKKPVRFDFLDYSTSRRRLLNCRREMELGRRLAPNVYLNVVPITADASGKLRLGGKGRPVAHAVKMRRLPHQMMLDALIRSGTVPPHRVRRLLALLVEFYRTAKRGAAIDRCARPQVILHNVEGNLAVLREHLDLFGRATLGKVQAAQLQLPQLRPELFTQRIASRRICEGHGDLRAEHVCMLPTPVVFDPVEFNQSLRSVDAIDELAFLAMECDFLGDERLGKTVLRSYQRGAGDEAPPELVGFYKCYRACVRAKVEVLREQQLHNGRRTGGPDGNDPGACRDRARRYLDLAAGYCDAYYRPRLVIVMGLMGTGKSTLATALADRLGMLVLRSDAVRHELAGRRDRAAGYEQGIYRAAFTRRVYAAMASRAEKLLSQGASVVLDATFLRRRYREQAREAARRAGAEVLGLHCRCTPAEILRRLAARSKKRSALSDARPELYEQQRRDFEPPEADEPIRAIDSRGSLDTLSRRAIRGLRSRA